MVICLWILGILLLILILICFLSIKIEVNLDGKSTHNSGEVKISTLYGLIKYGWKLKLSSKIDPSKGAPVEIKPLDTPTKKWYSFIGIESLRDLKRINDRFLDDFINVYELTRWFLGKITCDKLIWSTSIGTGRAEETGAITGLAWGIKGLLLEMFGRHINWSKEPSFAVNPYFNDKVFEYSFSSILHFKIGHAMIGALRLVKQYRYNR